MGEDSIHHLNHNQGKVQRRCARKRPTEVRCVHMGMPGVDVSVGVLCMGVRVLCVRMPCMIVRHRVLHREPAHSMSEFGSQIPELCARYFPTHAHITANAPTGRLDLILTPSFESHPLGAP